MIDTHQSDILGTLISSDTSYLLRHGLDSLVLNRAGRLDWGPLNLVERHPAHRILRHYKNHGVPVTLADSPWTHAEVEAGLLRGPHKSAYEFIEFLREDMADMVKKGIWTVVTYDSIKKMKGLRLSPIGVVPQRSRRPRPIVDYTFFGVNDATQPNVPVESMQFGRALERVLRRILLANPAYGKVYLIKIDLSDGFYRVNLRVPDIPKLGVLFPNLPEEPPLVALPLKLPMGWKNSPPGFSTATETIADIANRHLLQRRPVRPHPLDEMASSPPPPRPKPTNHKSRGQVAVPIPQRPDPHLNHHRRRRLHHVDVYVDDFMVAAQGNREKRNQVRSTLMHAIDDVFRPLAPSDSPSRKDPISNKKLRQGDAAWSTVKELLGWIIDTEAMTLQLPERRLQRLHDILHSDLLPSRRRLNVKDWHKILGELRSMSLALPGSRGLFSLLQEAFRHQLPDSRIKLTPELHSIFSDFRDLLRDLRNRPTRIQELVALHPTVHGCHDAAGHGAGGVIFPTEYTDVRRAHVRTQHEPLPRPQTDAGPIVWRLPFPPSVSSRLSTFENPRGPITNTDLELAGSVLQSVAAAHCFDIRERTNLQKTDNLGTLYWQRKGSITSAKVASTLLRYQALHQRYHRTVTQHDYIPGPINQLADDASRLQHLSDDDFLHHFDSNYPQKHSWRLWTLPSDLTSWLISTLQGQPSAGELPIPEPPPPIGIGAAGPTSAPNWPSTHSYKTQPSLSTSPYSKSTSTVTAQEQLRHAVSVSGQEQLRMPYVRLAKRSLKWGPGTRANQKTAPWISESHGKSAATKKRTRLLTG